MSMDRTRLLAEFWRYLPVFRVVAETGSLAEASRTLHVSPSALSRSISLPEEALEVSLFSRAGRSLTLTARGEAFLERVREAMRTVHDGYEASRGSLTAGPLMIYVAPELGPAPLRALVRAVRANPEIELRSTWLPRDDVAAALRRGELDLAAVSRTVEDPALDHAHIGELEVAVYRAASASALADSDSVVALASAVDGEIDDGWPAARGRTVVARAASWAELVSLCADGLGLAVLPVSAAADAVAQGRLVEVVGPRGKVPLVALRRRELVADAATLGIAALRDELGGTASVAS